MGLKQSIAQNLRKPSGGFIGHMVDKKVFQKKNVFTELHAVRLCRLEPQHHVLEIGFGPGVGLKAALEQIGDEGKVYGADYSSTMVEEASQLLRSAIDSSRLEVTLADVASLPYAAATMDRVFHCNCYYFWPEPAAAARELLRVLRPGGFMVTALCPSRVEEAAATGFLPGTNWEPRPYMETLRAAGFADITTEETVHSEGGKDIVYQAILAHKRD